MAFEAEEVYPNKRMKVGDQRTFAMAFSLTVSRRLVGNIVVEFEKKNLKVEAMQLMGVRRNFVKRHLGKSGRAFTFDSHPSFDLLHSMISGPIIVMILRGDDAVNKACEVVSYKRRVPLGTRSDSVKSAEEDIAMWFNEFGGGRLQKDVFYAFPNGNKEGDEDIFKDSVDGLCPYGIEPKLADVISWPNHVFLLISSAALRNYKVGEIIHVIERHCFSIRGMRRVEKAEVPHSKAWAEIGENEFGIAVLVDRLDGDHIKVLDKVDGLVHFDMDAWCVNLDRNMVYISKSGNEAWRLAGEFFKFGAVSWVERKNEEVEFFGGYFEASLIGLFE